MTSPNFSLLTPSAAASLCLAYSPAELDALDKTLQTPPLGLHLRVHRGRTTRDELLGKLRTLFGEPWASRLEPHAVLEDVLVLRRSKPNAALLRPCLELRETGAQRFAERRSAGLPAHEIVVDRICGEAVLKGANIFAAGIRGASMGVKAGDEVLVYAELACELLQGAAPAEVEGLVFLGRGTAVQDRAVIFAEKKGLAVTLTAAVNGDVPAMNGVLPDLLYSQSLPSLAVAHVLAPRPGDRVLDMCACPGSKTSHVATNFLSAAAGGRIYGCERNHGKLKRLKALAKLLGVADVVVPTRADSTDLVMTSSGAAGATAEKKEEGEEGEEEEGDDQESKGAGGACGDAAGDAAGCAAGGAAGAGDILSPATSHASGDHPLGPLVLAKDAKGRTRFAAGSFDAILLDPPCSALGLRPKLSMAPAMKEQEDLTSIAQLQKAFWFCAVQLLRPGGTLVYSTCTLAPEENEGMVAHVLATFGDQLALVKAEPRIGGPGRPGCGLEDEALLEMVQRFTPPEGGCEGFFIAKFQKKKKEEKEEKRATPATTTSACLEKQSFCGREKM